MSLQRPTIVLTVDGRALSGPEAALVRVRVDLGLGLAHDRAVMVCSLASPLVGTAVDADFTLELGYNDQNEGVLAGSVTRIETCHGMLVLEALAGSAAASRVRVAHSYVRETVADIVADLLGQTDAQVGEVEAPLTLGAYHVDEQRPVWRHLHELARLASCEVGVDKNGAVNFRPPRKGSGDHALRFGADLISWSVGPASADMTPQAVPTVVPYGAGSEAGADKWHILLKQPEGAGPKGQILIPSALRDRDAAQAFQDGLADAALRRGTAGMLAAVGNAAIRAGDLVELQGMPNSEDAVLRALAVSHAVGTGGFRTLIRIEGAAA